MLFVYLDGITPRLYVQGNTLKLSRSALVTMRYEIDRVLEAMQADARAESFIKQYERAYACTESRLDL